MLKVGLTGGIGSGKSTVAKIFEVLGIPVYYADDRAKDLMHTDPILMAEVKVAFGSDIYDADGQLQRKLLAERVFSDQTKLTLLNSLVHPAVFRDVNNWMQASEGAPYAVKEAALIFEAGSYRQLDFVITVTAPDEVRIERVMSRDAVSKDEVMQRMSKQLPQDEKENQSDFVIVNDGTKSLVEQVEGIHKTLLTSKPSG